MNTDNLAIVSHPRPEKNNVIPVNVNGDLTKQKKKNGKKKEKERKSNQEIYISTNLPRHLSPSESGA